MISSVIISKQDHIKIKNYVVKSLRQHHSKIKKIYVNYVKDDKNGLLGLYGKADGYGKLFIHRKDITKPNISWFFEIPVLLHEFGHSLLLNIKQASSKTGYLYYLKDNKNPNSYFDVLKEEVCAWVVAYQELGKINIKWWKKLLLLPWMMFFTAYCLFSYAIDVEEKTAHKIFAVVVGFFVGEIIAIFW